MEIMPRRSKGIFVTISVFFLVLALLLIVGLMVGIESGKKQSYSDVSDLAEINSIKSNIEWMAKEAFSVSGFGYSVYNRTLSITENASKRGSLYRDLTALEEFWNGVAGKNVSLDFYANASTPVLYVRDTNITVIQRATNTTVTVPGYSNSSVLAYYLTVKTSCSSLAKTWSNLSETAASDALNFTIGVKCTDSSDSLYDFRQLDRLEYNELQITDDGSNVTVIRIISPGSIEIIKFKSAYLNILMPMNENVYFEVPSSLNITKGDAAYSGALRLPGDLE